jgi:hypothetical protein
MKKYFLLITVLCVISAGCGTVQSIVKSTFPYTTTVVVPASSQPGNEYAAVSYAKSFDQSFSKGNNAYAVKDVKVTSAKLESTTPSDFNIGNLVSANIYIAGEDGKDEVLVASRNDIGPNVGNSLVLDIDNSATLDQYVRKPKLKVRMVYKLRHNISVDVSLKLVLGLKAHAS